MRERQRERQRQTDRGAYSIVFGRLVDTYTHTQRKRYRSIKVYVDDDNDRDLGANGWTDLFARGVGGNIPVELPGFVPPPVAAG